MTRKSIPDLKRLDRLRERALRIHLEARRAARSRLCARADRDTVARLIGEATRPEDLPILRTILEQIKDFAARSRTWHDGTKSPHAFTQWADFLVMGWGALPEQFPTAFLTAWRDGYEPHFHDGLPWSPIPMRRCESCRLVLPNCGPDGGQEHFSSCPACGCERLSWRSLAHPGEFKMSVQDMRARKSHRERR